MIAAVGGLALAGVPQALADPIPVSPADEETVTARVGLTFQATVDEIVPPAPAGRMDFYVSRSETAGANGVLSTPIEPPFFDFADTGTPPTYEGRPDPESDWPNKPRTYYWQPVYHNCGFADPQCFGEIRSLTIEPLPPPEQTAPADAATIPFGGKAVFSIQDVPSYRRAGTRIFLEFSKNGVPRPNGRLADRFLAEPHSVGGGVYEYRLTDSIAEWPGTYYWIVERFDCFAPDDCYVTNDEIRSFTVEPPVGTPAPETIITRHPARRTRKRRVRFAFVSNLPNASFQCHYTGGWSRCESPQRFRHLKPGRYRFKVRAVANGKRDTTAATWLFRVLRRR